MATTQGFATLLWIILLFALVVVYFILFRQWNKLVAASNPPTPRAESKRSISPNDGTNQVNPMVAPVVVKEVSNLEPVAASNIRTNFGQKMIEEYVFDNSKSNTLYSVGIDKEMIKVTRIWSRQGKQVELAYGSDPSLFRRTLATAEFSANMKSAPLALFTHIESYAEGTRPSLNFFRWLVGWWRFFVRNSVFFLVILMTLAVILTFYVPGTMDTATSGDHRAKQSKALTMAIFLLTAVSLLIHLVYLNGCRSADKTNGNTNPGAASILPIAALVFLVVAVAISAVLLSITLDGSSSADTSDKKDSFVNAVQGFTCYCAGLSPTGAPTEVPTHQPTTNITYDNDYSFLCTSDELAAADYNSCDMNCGVCGDDYYQPFVSYTAFAACYVFLILYLAFDAWFGGHFFFANTAPDSNYDAHTHMAVTIHGSDAFGYPLFARLGLQEYLLLEEYLSNYSEREQARRNGDFLNHMKQVGSNITQQTVTKKVSKSFEYFAKFLWIVIKIGARIIGIPL